GIVCQWSYEHGSTITASYKIFLVEVQPSSDDSQHSELWVSASI
ncbi:unnamed protein product, partial [marine sediment metagenome]